jgi:DNA adenine methylase
MRYFGGKSRIAKQIAGFINKELKAGQPYVEPFCGACWVVSNIATDRIRIANDYHKDLILMWQELQNGWVPPNEVSEELYSASKKAEPSALRGIIGFGCSNSGKWFGGYARDKTNRNYAQNAKNSVIKKIGKMGDVVFHNSSYEDLNYPPNSLIYCDPPYANTTGYSTGAFDHIAFWEWVRQMTNVGHNVLVSEYTAPEDFDAVLTINVKTDMKAADQSKIDRVERLFKFRGV